MGDQLKKRDAGKPQLSLLPFRPLVLVTRVLEFGKWKYARDGWKSVDNAEERYLDALLRHTADIADHGLGHLDVCAKHEGKRPAGCKECSGLPTLAHLVCDGMFLLWYKFKEFDPGRPWEEPEVKSDVPG